MTRNFRLLGSGILGLASLTASAGPPGTVPPPTPASGATATVPLGTRPTVAAPSGATATVSQLAAPPDGNLHVSVSVNVNVSLNPLATGAALLCVALVDEHNTVTGWAVNINSGFSPSDTSFQALFVHTGGIATNSVQVWNQTLSLPLRGGMYHGVQSVAFVVPAQELHEHHRPNMPLHNPALLFTCALQVTGPGMSGPPETTFAVVQMGGPQLATPANLGWVSGGTNAPDGSAVMFAVAQDVILKPLT